MVGRAGGGPVFNGTRASVWGAQLWWVTVTVMTAESSELSMCVLRNGERAERVQT